MAMGKPIFSAAAAKAASSSFSSRAQDTMFTPHCCSMAALSRSFKAIVFLSAMAQPSSLMRLRKAA